MSGYTKILVALLAIAAVIGSTLGEIAAARTAQRSSGSADNASSPACSEPGQVVDRGNGWTSTTIPRFPNPIEGGDNLPAGTGDTVLGGNRPVRSFAVDPRDPARIFVTDGHTIMRSLDRGCTWEVVFRAAEVLPIEIPRWPDLWQHSDPISQIEIPESTGSDDGAKIYAVVSAHSMTHAPTKTWIVAGNRKGDPDSWAVRSELLLTTPAWDAPPPLLEFSPQDGEVGYLVHWRQYEIQSSVRQLDQLVTYKTTDAGITWNLRSEIPSQLNPRRLIVGDTETLWVLHSDSPGPYAMSPDGGTNWHENTEFPLGRGVLDFESTELNGRDVLVGLLVGPNTKPDPDGNIQLGIYLGLSHDQGLTWDRWAPTQGRVDGVYMWDHQFGVGPTADSMLYASATNVWRFDRRLVGRSSRPPWVDVTPVGLPKGGSSPHGYATFQDVVVSLDGRKPIYSVLMYRPVSSDPLVPAPPQELWQYTGPSQRAARG